MCSPVSLTEAARSRMATILDTNQHNTITLRVTSKGCGGHGYALDLGESEGERIDLGDAKQLVVETASVFWLVGTEIDYVETGMGGSFKFNNPLAMHSCACGKSFAC